MRRVNTIVKTTISRLLLLYFVIAIIPLDLYHHHGFTDLTGNRQELTAAKSLSQSIFTSHCLVCDFHFDRQAYHENIPVMLSFYETAGSLILFHYQQTIYESTAVQFNLRGPPLNQA